MIPKHSEFLEALHERKKVSVRFYSIADSEVVDRICAPLDYGPASNDLDALNVYSFWDYAAIPEPRVLGLVTKQILDFQVLGESFVPNDLTASPLPWTIPREWGPPTPIVAKPIPSATS